MVDVSLFRRGDVIAMCVAMGILFTLEMLGVFNDRYITITAIIRSLPKWSRSMILGWLAYHFIIQ